MGKYLILACDGGGIRGYITASVIEKLIGDPRARNFLPEVRLTAGTSTGSFIALALAAGKDIAAIKALCSTTSSCRRCRRRASPSSAAACGPRRRAPGFATSSSAK